MSALEDLKIKLLTSIVAISAVHLLESFMNIDQTSDRELEWSLGIQITLVLTGVLLAIMHRSDPAISRGLCVFRLIMCESLFL